MKRVAIIAAVCGLVGARAGAQDLISPYAAYSPPQAHANGSVGAMGMTASRPATFMPPTMTASVPAATSASIPTVGQCGLNTGCETCRHGRVRGERIRKLLDFLLFRPTKPCDCAMKPTTYVPPLVAWFPNKCNANGGNCGPVTKNCGKTCHQGGHRPACATCAASLGTPVAMGGPTPPAPQVMIRQGTASPGLRTNWTVPKTPYLPIPLAPPATKPMTPSAPVVQTSTMLRTIVHPPLPPYSPAATTPNLLPSTFIPPSSPVQSQSQPADTLPLPRTGLPGGYRVQPGSYYLPERQ